MKKLFQRFRRDDRGVAAVEYALMVPLLSVLLVGITDYGMFIHQKMKLDDLARECVLYVFHGGDSANMQTAVIQESDIYKAVDSTQGTVTYTLTQVCECSNGSSVNCSTTGTCPATDYKRTFYEATVTATYTTILPWPGIAPASKTMSGYARMQYY
jgi:Flp pilus assembly protein TadG